ncbi:MAG: prepilin-type N-terminal cleavage/methylation domain-containing protein [Patescibacteria group bacterium]
MDKQRGFTFIETLIALAVIALIITITISSYRYFEKNTELENTAQKIVSVLKSAQTKTLASEQASQYGVHFENDKYILFKGDTHQPEADDNIDYQLPNRLEIVNISLNGEGADVVFQRINGQTEQNGTIDLRIISQPSKLETVNIHSTGQIELASSLGECCQTNRLIDGRHIHFNLGWSIQSSAVLTLYFPDTPEVIVNINMADYFNLSQTEFDWSGTIEVNGQNQELRVHTHSLDAVNTILCIHRDNSQNNKPLQISIDGKEIISYTADGQATVGFWGGIMEIQ